MNRVLARDYTSISAVGGFIALLLAMITIIAVIRLDEVTEYFAITLVLIIGIFAVLSIHQRIPQDYSLRSRINWD